MKKIFGINDRTKFFTIRRKYDIFNIGKTEDCNM